SPTSTCILLSFTDTPTTDLSTLSLHDALPICHVQPLVEGPIVDRAVAEERDRDAARLQQLEAVARPRGLEDARPDDAAGPHQARSEEHTSELQSLTNLVCRLLLEKKKTHNTHH